VKRSVSLLEDHHQKLLFPTTIGGGATTVELAHQVVERRRQSKSSRLAGLASDWADRRFLVAMCLATNPLG
jgi:NADH dehydrogenase FAD-containing subunit